MTGGTERSRDRRQVWRRRLLLAGVLPALGAAAFATEVAVVLHHDAEGRAALADGDPDRAARAYAANRTLNLLEPWVAPYDEATALFRGGDAAGAVRGYTAALPLAPEAQQCRVRTDLALAHATAGAPARGVAALADCPADDPRAAEALSALQEQLATAEEAAADDERTETPPQAPTGSSEGRQDTGRPEQAAQQGALRERNDRGRERRQQAEDRADGTGIGAGRGTGRGDPGAGGAGTPAYSW